MSDIFGPSGFLLCVCKRLFLSIVACSVCMQSIKAKPHN